MATYNYQAIAPYLTLLIIAFLLALSLATSFEIDVDGGYNGHGSWGYQLGHEPDSNPPCTGSSSGSAPGSSNWNYGIHRSPDGHSGQVGFGFSSPDGHGWSGGGGGAWSTAGSGDGTITQGGGGQNMPYTFPCNCACDCDDLIGGD